MTTVPDPTTLRSRAAHEKFVSDLPSLLAQFPGKWVAYSTQERVGIANSKTELYRRCRAVGLVDDEFVVRFIGTDTDQIELGAGVVEFE